MPDRPTLLKGTRVRFTEERVAAKPDLAGEWTLRRTASSRDAVLFLHRDSDGANVATSRALVVIL